MSTMLLRLCLLLCALLSVRAKGKKDSNQLILDEEVLATFEYNGKRQRIWSEHRSPEYFNLSLEDQRYFYEPVIVPFVRTENQNSVMVCTDPSIESADRHKAKLFLSTNDSEVYNLAYHTVKMALKTGIEMKTANVQPLPIMKLKLSLLNSPEDPPNSGKQCRFSKTFDNPGPIVELVMPTDSEEKAEQIARLLEKNYISYSMDVDLDSMVKRRTITCKNGKVKIFVPLKGSINLAHIQSQRLLSVNEKLQKDAEINEEALKNALKENQDLKEEFQTKIKQMQEKIVNLKEDKEKDDQMKEGALRNALKENHDFQMKVKQMQDRIIELTEDKAKTDKIHEKMLSLEDHLKTIQKMVRCLPGWTAFCFLGSCSCYRIFPDTKFWHDALQICKNVGSDLASIHSDEEHTFIHMLNGPTWMGDLWIGLNDISEEGQFQWSDKTAVSYTRWSQSRSGEDCGEMRGGGMWYVYGCSTNQRYVCKQRL